MADFYVDSTIDFEVPNDNQFSVDPAVVFCRFRDVAPWQRQAFKYLLEHSTPQLIFVRSGDDQRFSKLMTTSPKYERSANAVG